MSSSALLALVVLFQEPQDGAEELIEQRLDGGRATAVGCRRAPVGGFSASGGHVGSGVEIGRLLKITPQSPICKFVGATSWPQFANGGARNVILLCFFAGTLDFRCKSTYNYDNYVFAHRVPNTPTPAIMNKTAISSAFAMLAVA